LTETTIVISMRQQTLTDLIDAFGEGFWELSVTDGNVVNIDASTACVVGLDGFEGCVEFDKFMELVKDEDRAGLLASFEKAVTDPDGLVDVEYRLLNKKYGKYRWVRAIGKTYKDEGRVTIRGTTQILEGGMALRSLSRQLDLADKALLEREKQIRDLTQVAYTDPLTGLYNRRHFMELSTTHLERARRYHLSCFMMMMDLDYFKKINDAHGHLVGDEVLKNIANLLKKALRSYDLLARYGGEEFVVFIADANREAVASLGERIRVSIQKNPYTDDAGNKIGCTVSIGVAENGPDYAVASLLNLADRKLYEAKEQGRNRVVFA